MCYKRPDTVGIKLLVQKEKTKVSGFVWIFLYSFSVCVLNLILCTPDVIYR